MSQQQNQPPPGRPSSPFGSPASRPTYGSPPGTRPGSSPAASPSAPTPPTAPRPFGGLSRFGANRTDWRIISVSGPLIRFDLNGLGDPFHRLLRQPLTVEYGNYEAVIKAIEADGELATELGACLDSSW